MPNPQSPYFRLMRLHQPVGIWLLLWPCWWSVALASNGSPSLYILGLFAIGAILMRSAGCIINDIIDRDIDKRVERTRTRPLASGELSVKQALILLTILVMLSVIIAWNLGLSVVMWSALSLIPVVIYPFMKRISWWPQLFLGLTFNWGALVGWVAVRGEVELPAVILYVSGVFWTLGYDTIYAHQDKIDDVNIGVKSTALRLGNYTKRAVGIFYLFAILGLVAAGIASDLTALIFSPLMLALLHLGWQLCNVDLDNPLSCRRIFVSNIYVGGLVFISYVIGHF
jgi:4-hydroxybenzoate polyprenyltransferase